MRRWKTAFEKTGGKLHFTTRISGDSSLTKMSAELPSTEQIFTETSRLVPLVSWETFDNSDCN